MGIVFQAVTKPLASVRHCNSIRREGNALISPDRPFLTYPIGQLGAGVSH